MKGKKGHYSSLTVKEKNKLGIKKKLGKRKKSGKVKLGKIS